jgi:hypothetical protein
VDQESNANVVRMYANTVLKFVVLVEVSENTLTMKSLDAAILNLFKDFLKDLSVD